jgi:hypothetical protein
VWIFSVGVFEGLVKYSLVGAGDALRADRPRKGQEQNNTKAIENKRWAPEGLFFS